MFCGALEFHSPVAALRGHADTLVQRACRYAHQRSRQLHQDTTLALFSIEPSDTEVTDIVDVNDAADLPCWFYELTGLHTNNISATREKLAQYSWEVPLAHNGQWVGIRWDERGRKLRIASDFLGSVWLYIARTEYGYLLAHDFGALVGHPAVKAKLNEENILVELGIGYIPDNETLYHDISIVPPGAVIEFSSEGMKTIAKATPEYGDRYAGCSQQEKFEQLDRLYRPIYASAIANQLEQSCISLSAGLDSRYALGMLQAKGDQCSAFTFGIHNSEEVFEANQIAALADIQLTCFNFERTSWQGWRRCIEQLGGIGMVQWVGWAEEWLQLLAREHRYVLIGYLGDALSGKHLIRSQPKTDWQQTWLDWSLDSWAHSTLLQPNCRASVKDLVSGKLRGLAAGINTAYPHQLAMHLDLYGRQRRWVASQPNLMARFIHPKTYFLNQELVQFWSNLMFEDLDQQHLYKAYAQNRFPRFFTADSRRISLLNRLQKKISREAGKFLGRQSTQRVSHVIDRGKIISQNHAQIQELIIRTEEKLGHVIDYAKFRQLLDQTYVASQATQANTGLLLRGINLMILVDGQ